MLTRPVVSGVTVDEARSWELDDAFWVAALGDGSFRITVSIADVAQHVPIGSIDDEVASSRGLTVYGNSSSREGMLPPQIARNLASLAPGKIRPAVSFYFDVDPEGAISGIKAERTILKSAAKFSYGEFDDYCLGDTKRPHSEMAHCALRAASALWKGRMQFASPPEWDAAFDEFGLLKTDLKEGVLSQTIVHEFMVAANSCGATILAQQGIPMIFRNQGPRLGGSSGRYEIISQGQLDLGKEHYGQFTSPIRRYVDLVNQRILCAYIASEPSPYDPTALAYIASEANRLAQRADNNNRHRLTSVSKVYDDESPRYDRMTVEDILAAATRPLSIAREGGFEIMRRFDCGRLRHSDLATLLFTGRGKLELSMSEEIFRRLLANPTDMEKIWDQGRLKNLVADFDCTTQRLGDGFSAMVSHPAGVFNAAEYEPDRARGHALTKLGAAIHLGHAASLSHLTPMPSYVSDDYVLDKLTALGELMGWQKVEINVEPRNSPGGIFYKAFVELAVDDFFYRSPKAYGPTYEDAEFEAAALALAALDPLADYLLAQDMQRYLVDLDLFVDEIVDESATVAIENFAKRYGATIKYHWQTENSHLGRYRCVGELGASGNKLRSTGHGETRAEAIESAAFYTSLSILDVRRKEVLKERLAAREERNPMDLYDDSKAPQSGDLSCEYQGREMHLC